MYVLYVYIIYFIGPQYIFILIIIHERRHIAVMLLSKTFNVFLLYFLLFLQPTFFLTNSHTHTFSLTLIQHPTPTLYLLGRFQTLIMKCSPPYNLRTSKEPVGGALPFHCQWLATLMSTCLKLLPICHFKSTAKSEKCLIPKLQKVFRSFASPPGIYISLQHLLSAH